MEFIGELHRVISLSSVIFLGFVGIWGFIRAIRNGGVDGSYMGALVIGEVLLVLQGLLGLILVIDGARPGRIDPHRREGGRVGPSIFHHQIPPASAECIVALQ